MLGRLRMSVDEAIENYHSLYSGAFDSPKFFGELRNRLFGTPIYDASILEDGIKRIVTGSDAT